MGLVAVASMILIWQYTTQGVREAERCSVVSDGTAAEIEMQRTSLNSFEEIAKKYETADRESYFHRNKGTLQQFLGHFAPHRKPSSDPESVSLLGGQQGVRVYDSPVQQGFPLKSQSLQEIPLHSPQHLHKASSGHGI
ncbi:hypothetical protein HDU91_002899 [Kappamyces sp. JEL0680]|nr:hypothetical protein HDU91_002899 [Kappamyces sp. JEL0680]